MNAQQHLQNLSHALVPIHKSLLNHQKEIQEQLDERRLSSHELLQHCIQHPNFEWLRDLSALMASIDENADGTDEEASFYEKEAISKLEALFVDEAKEVEFKSKLEVALKLDPTLWLELVQLKKQIKK